MGRSVCPGAGGSSHDEREQTLNQILEMDGFDGERMTGVWRRPTERMFWTQLCFRPGRFDGV